MQRTTGAVVGEVLEYDVVHAQTICQQGAVARGYLPREGRMERRTFLRCFERFVVGGFAALLGGGRGWHDGVLFAESLFELRGFRGLTREELQLFDEARVQTPAQLRAVAPVVLWLADILRRGDERRRWVRPAPVRDVALRRHHAEFLEVLMNRDRRIRIYEVVVTKPELVIASRGLGLWQARENARPLIGARVVLDSPEKNAQLAASARVADFLEGSFELLRTLPTIAQWEVGLAVGLADRTILKQLAHQALDREVRAEHRRAHLDYLKEYGVQVKNYGDYMRRHAADGRLNPFPEYLELLERSAVDVFSESKPSRH